MTKKTKSLLAIALLIALGLLGYYGWKTLRQPKVNYRSEVIKRGDIAINIVSTGTVQPENRVEIKPPIAGRIEQVLVNEGQVVKKGQILAWMSSTERAALLDAAKSRGAEEIRRWEDNYRPTPVLAPINGTIILRNTESGQTFTANDAILVMSDRLTVKAQVDETDLAQIKNKQSAQLVLDAYPQEKIAATVSQIAYEAKTVNNVTTYVVDVLPLKTPDFMRSGMTANVSFAVDHRENVLVIPSEAVKVIQGKATTLVQVPESHPETREIKIGLSDGKSTEVISGLNEGDTILITAPLRERASGTSSPLSPMGGRPRGR